MWVCVGVCVGVCVCVCEMFILTLFDHGQLPLWIAKGVHVTQCSCISIGAHASLCFFMAHISLFGYPIFFPPLLGLKYLPENVITLCVRVSQVCKSNVRLRIAVEIQKVGKWKKNSKKGGKVS